MSELNHLATHLEQMLSALSDAQMAQLKKTLATKLRQSQSRRIGANQNPDGSPYTPRKRPKRTRSGRVRNKMMNTIKQARHMRTEQTSAGFAIRYAGRMAGIAAVHQYGLKARVSPDSHITAAYPVRQLLGVSEEDKRMIEETVLGFLERVF